MKLIGAVAIALALCACETTPIVTPQPNIAAIQQSNEQTRKHIENTRRHIKEIETSGAHVDDNLKAAKEDLDRVLKQ